MRGIEESPFVFMSAFSAKKKDFAKSTPDRRSTNSGKSAALVSKEEFA